MSGDDGFSMGDVDPWAVPPRDAVPSSSDPWASPSVDPFQQTTPTKPPSTTSAANKAKPAPVRAPVQPPIPTAQPMEKKTPTKWDAFGGLTSSTDASSAKKSDPFEFLGSLTSGGKKKPSAQPSAPSPAAAVVTPAGKAVGRKYDMFTSMLFPDPPSKTKSAKKTPASPAPVSVAPDADPVPEAAVARQPTPQEQTTPVQLSAVLSDPPPSEPSPTAAKLWRAVDGIESPAHAAAAPPELYASDAMGGMVSIELPSAEAVYDSSVGVYSDSPIDISPRAAEEQAIGDEDAVSESSGRSAVETDSDVECLVTEEPTADAEGALEGRQLEIDVEVAVTPTSDIPISYLSELNTGAHSPLRDQHTVTLCDTPPIIKDASHPPTILEAEEMEGRIGYCSSGIPAVRMPDNVPVLAALSEWLTREADVVPSVANGYATVMVSRGVGTYRRLATKLTRNTQYLVSDLGFDTDDAADVVAAMVRLGHLPADFSAPPLVSTPPALAREEIAEPPAVTMSIAPPEEPEETSISPLVRSSSAPPVEVQSPNSPLTRKLCRQSSGGSTGQPGVRGQLAPAAPTRTKEEMEQLRKVSHIAQAEYQDLRASVEARDVYSGLASVENLSNLLQARQGGSDAQLILGHLGVCALIVKAIDTFKETPVFVQKALPTLCFLCATGRGQAATNADNLLALGLAGAPQLVVEVLRKYQSNELVATWACSAVRRLATLHSNKSRLGAAGACQAVADVLIKNPQMETIAKYALRAVGHLTNEHDRNRQLFVDCGFCKSVVSIVNSRIGSLGSVVEGCWAIRKLAISPLALAELIKMQLAELLGGLFARHGDEELVCMEVLRVVATVCTTLSSETVSIPREVLAVEPVPGSSGSRRSSVSVAFNVKTASRSTSSITGALGEHLYISKLQAILMRPLYKAMSKRGKASKVLLVLQWCCRAIVSMAANSDIVKRFVENKFCEMIVYLVHEHDDPMLMEWCCHAVVALTVGEGANAKLRGLGGCELVVIVMQKLVKIPDVVKAAAGAISALAQEPSSSHKLGQTGGCDAAIIALSRYIYNPPVVGGLLECIHNLALQPNNRAWLGAAGACELVVKATRAHIDSEEVASAGCRAFGSLSMGHPKNTQRLRNAHGAECTIAALKNHSSVRMSVDATRAVQYMGTGCELFGACGACEAVVTAMERHKGLQSTTTGACKAIGALIGAENAINKNNAAKLIRAGANEIVTAAMQAHVRDSEACVDICFAIAQLAIGTEENRVTLGSMGACELAGGLLSTHGGAVDVVIAVAVVVEKLSRRNTENKRRFGNARVCELLFSAMDLHGADEALVAHVFRALVVLFYYTDNRSRSSTPEHCRTLTRPLRRHKHNADIVCSGAMAITTLIYDDATASLLGLCKAPEALLKAMARHTDDPGSSEWGCYALWKLTTLDSNKQVLSTMETTDVVLSILKAHRDIVKVNEWAIKLLIHLASYDDTAMNRALIDNVGISESISGRTEEFKGEGMVPVKDSAHADTFMHSMLAKAHRRGSSATQFHGGAKSSSSGFGSVGEAMAWESNRSKFITGGAAELLVSAVKHYYKHPVIVRFGIEALYSLAIAEDAVGSAAISAAGATGLLLLALHKYEPKPARDAQESTEGDSSVPPHEDLLMQTVRFAICLMKGKTELSRSNARQLYQGNLCQSVANLLKCFKTNTTHVSWMCSSVSLLCQRVADSQQVFGKQTDICKTLSQKELWVLVMPSPTALLTLIKAIRALCYSHEENRRAFCILRVADEAISAVGHCDLGTEVSGPILEMACWAMARLAVPTSAFLSSTSAAAARIVAKTLSAADTISPKTAHNALEAIVTLTRPPYADNAGQLGNLGVCENVMAALTRHATESSLLDLGFIVVSALCQQCAANKRAFQRAGVVSYTLRILSRGTCTQRAVGLGLGALTAVADDNRDLLYDLTSANALRIVNQACMSVPDSNWSDEFAQLYCVFLGRLASIGPAVQRKLSQLNFIELLMRCVTKHLVSLPVCRAAMWAVSELTFRSSDHSSRLGALGACEGAVSVLKLHRNAPLVELWACAALANLTASDTQGSTGTVDNVNRAVTVGIGGEIVRLLRSTLEVIESSGSSRRPVSVKHGAAADGSILGSDVDLLKFALWTLCNICLSSAARVALEECGACAALLNTLAVFHEHNAHITHLTLCAVSAMAQERSCREYFLVDGERSLTSLLNTIDAYYSSLSDTESGQLCQVLAHTRERLHHDNSWGPAEFEPLQWDVSDGAAGFCLRHLSMKLVGMDLSDQKPSLGKAMSKRFSMSLDLLSGPSAQTGALQRPSSLKRFSSPTAAGMAARGAVMSEPRGQGQEGAHENAHSLKSVASVVMAMNKFKRVGSGHKL